MWVFDGLVDSVALIYCLSDSHGFMLGMDLIWTDDLSSEPKNQDATMLKVILLGQYTAAGVKVHEVQIA